MSEPDLSFFYYTDYDGQPRERLFVDRKSTYDIMLVVHHHKDPDNWVVDRFIELHLETRQWDWLIRYREWEAKVNHYKALYEKLPDLEDGSRPPMYKLSDPPERPEMINVSMWRAENPEYLIYPNPKFRRPW